VAIAEARDQRSQPALHIPRAWMYAFIAFTTGLAAVAALLVAPPHKAHTPRSCIMTIGLICLAAVLLLAFLRVPLGIALLTVSIGGITYLNSFDVARTLVPMTLGEAAFSYELAVVPLFILMGNVLSRTGISDDLFRAANAFLGAVRGGLALATMVTCAGFSAVCGSSFATAATMAKVAYPSMKKYGYSDRLASATIAAGGTLGILIPPSIILMIYGILTQQNIGELFIAGVLPGLLGLAMYMGW
jgi:tripartite ATP-independent transporter DctM subunit